MEQLSKQFPDPLAIRLANEPDFVLGTLQVRASLRELDYGDRKEQLEPRVMQVLVALARAPGAVVSRDELIARCWDGRIVGEAAINRCISKLREISESSGEAFRIETIARVGYRLISAEQTPDGAAAKAAGDGKSRDRGGHLAPFALLIAMVVVVGAVMAYYALRPRAVPGSPATAVRETSIAVLPFKNLSSDKDAGFLAAGVQDEILTRLAKIGSLRVISRTSADQYASWRGNLPEVARRLGAANILEGSVQKSGNSVRINVQLIQAATDDHLWAEDYDRSMDDVLQVESDVAGTIADVLAAKVTAAERKEIGARPTADPRAYGLFLRAVVLARRSDDDSAQNAVKLLDDATRLDPKFALAWAWLARMQAFIHFGDKLADVRRGPARAALATALELQPDLAEAEAAKGFYLYYGEMNYPAAERELERVHARWPNNSEALEALALILRREGKWRESTDDFAALIALDPLVPSHREALAGNLLVLHEFGEALRGLDAALAVLPDDDALLAMKAEAYQDMGRLDAASAVLKKIRSASDETETGWVISQQFRLRRQYREGAAFCRGLIETKVGAEQPSTGIRSCLGDFLRLSGDIQGANDSYSKALSVLQGELKQQPDNGVFLRRLAYVYAGMGNGSLALATANRAVEQLRSSGDALEGVITEANRVGIMARFGDRDEAVAELARLMKLPGGDPPAILRLDPDFDRLRGDPRFERLAHGGM